MIKSKVIYLLPPDIGHPAGILPSFFMLAHFAGLQSFISPHFEGSQAPAAAGFAFALLAQQLFLSPAAAGFAFALLAQQLFLSPAAAGFAFALLAQQLLLPEAAGFALALLEQQLLLPEAAGFVLAVAIGQAAVPALSQDFFMSEHFDGSQFAGSHLEPSHCIAVALALTFSVLLQPITAKPSAATRVRVSSCFIIIFLQKRCERGKNDLSDVLYSI